MNRRDVLKSSVVATMGLMATRPPDTDEKELGRTQPECVPNPKQVPLSEQTICGLPIVEVDFQRESEGGFCAFGEEAATALRKVVNG